MIKVIWNDTHWYRTFSYLGTFFLLLFFVYPLISDPSSNNIIDILLFGGISTFFLYLFVATLTTKLTYVVSDGIRIGNATTDTYSKIELRKKPVLIKWNLINSIEIKNKIVRHGWILFVRSFLIIISKDGKKYESFLANPKGFTEVLKNQGKLRLLKIVKLDKLKNETSRLNNVTAITWKWTLFSIIWIVIAVTSSLFWRFKYGVFDNKLLIIWWLIIIVPPLAYLFIIKNYGT